MNPGGEPRDLMYVVGVAFSCKILQGLSLHFLTGPFVPFSAILGLTYCHENNQSTLAYLKSTH